MMYHHTHRNVVQVSGCAVLSLLLLMAGTRTTASTSREKLLDFGWRFSLGDAASATKDFGFGLEAAFAKAGDSPGPASRDFNDSSWRKLDLPHDWAVELDFDSSSGTRDHGFKPIGRNFPQTSVGWYRRTFVIPQPDSGKRTSVKFEGVFRDCLVWFNGHFLGRHLSGYGEFSFDLTDYIVYGARNILALRVDATQAEGWFYEGAGIYRHVWLITTPPLHIPLYGVYVSTNVLDRAATVTVRTKISNQDFLPKNARLHVIVASEGTAAAEASSESAMISAGEERDYVVQLNLAGPRLWSPDHPSLYHAMTIVEEAGSGIDTVDTPFGIRSIRFDKDSGFFLNGSPVKIKGVCCHQDHAGVGSALPDRLQYYRIERLKEMGCNAYRTSHNPPDPSLLDACDRLGMLVMDENRLMGGSPELTAEFERLILRDRNHPSVIIWSIGNEEWAIQNNATGRRIARTLKRRQQELDPGRLCTYAADNGSRFEGINSVVDVRGVNYLGRGDIDAYHHAHADQPVLGTEEASTYCTRGVYANDTARGFVSDYDVNAPGYGSTAEKWWTYVSARPWFAGSFVWTGFDYRGEPSPYSWPCINSHFGIMDVCGFPKNNFYYYQAWWSSEDVIHLAPHWNWAEGQKVSVWCQTNCDSVELFLDGNSLGRKTVNPNSHLAWEVDFRPGRLEARGWRKGKDFARMVETAGKTSRIRLFPDRSTIEADREDVCIVNVAAFDRGGREDFLADNLIKFELEGVGRIIGVGNGNPSSHEKDKCASNAWQRRLFNGKCQILIQSGGTPGSITLRATSDGLEPASITVKARSATIRPSVPE